MLDDDAIFLLLVPPLLSVISGAGAVGLCHFLTSSATANTAVFVVGVVVGWQMGKKLLEAS